MKSNTNLENACDHLSVDVSKKVVDLEDGWACHESFEEPLVKVSMERYYVDYYLMIEFINKEPCRASRAEWGNIEDKTYQYICVDNSRLMFENKICVYSKDNNEYSHYEYRPNKEDVHANDWLIHDSIGQLMLKEEVINLLEERQKMSENNNKEIHDPVNHPSHYKKHPSGIECIELTRHMNYNMGSSFKYIFRHGLKTDSENSSERETLEFAIRDLKKSEFHIKDEIKRLEKLLGEIHDQC